MNNSLEVEYQETLHQALDYLVADFIYKTDRMPSQTNLFDFMAWSKTQVPHFQPRADRFTATAVGNNPKSIPTHH